MRPRPTPDEPTVRVPEPREARTDGRPQVLVAVGTDKHPFDRLVDWLRHWHDEIAGEVRLTVQHGHTRAADLPDAVPFLGHAELQAAMARSDLVVCHGGPATILEARRHGHLPIVVPRDPTRGEHVDDHQLLFARRLGAAGLVALCESRQELLDTLATGLADRARFTVAVDADAADGRRAAVRRVGVIVEDLVAAAQRQHRPWWRPWRGPNGRRKP
ncbi:glycosyltransferase [Verrucosispora sioxanthis]|uniref:Glycosyl transferase family 28 n=1 Tax=Verrucosispora sioxanthis TaxID=2499994 RepID=A0A6M1KMY1_9ACTN|nr:glycosyl transferase family 28 [Verrucosispora sioxanthis]NGM11248.1 glycosyl transferase family 28 [Verrucosispora sioxanthis]